MLERGTVSKCVLDWDSSSKVQLAPSCRLSSQPSFRTTTILPTKDNYSLLKTPSN